MEIINYSAIPATPAAGFISTVEAKGHFISSSPHSWLVSNASAVQAIYDTYAGGSDELEWNRTQLQGQLDTNLNNNFNLIAFIRDGTLTTLTGTNVANFLANSTNNYRSLRQQIASATTLAQLQAININAGWPSNP